MLKLLEGLKIQVCRMLAEKKLECQNEIDVHRKGDVDEV